MRKLSLLIIALLCGSLHAQQIIEPIPLVTVTGEAAEKAAPDVIIIQYRLTEKVTPPVTSTLFIEMDKLDVSMKFVNVDNEEITVSLDILKNNSSNYLLIKEFIITLNDIKKYREVLTQLLQLSKGEIKAIEFRTSKLAEYKNSARVKAIKAAEEKANLLATTLGQTIGKAFTITDDPLPLTNWYDKLFPESTKHDNMITDTYLEMPGYIVVPAKVTVSFELK